MAEQHRAGPAARRPKALDRKADYAGKGTVGGSLAFLLIVVPTEWLGWLPPVPDGFLLPMIGALGTVLTAVLALILQKRTASS